MRAEQRWSGLVAGVLGRAVRFGSGLLITTLCLMRYGADAWGVVVVVLSLVDLLLGFDLALPELCAYIAAREDVPAPLRRGIAAALWLVALPTSLAWLTLAAAAGPLRALLLPAGNATLLDVPLVIALAGLAYPITVAGSALGGVLQGLGRLRELNLAFATASGLELAAVGLAVLLKAPLEIVQATRLVAQVLRLLLVVWPLRGVLPRFVELAPPAPRDLTPLLRYAGGYSVAKALGFAVHRCAVPLGQHFVGPALLAGYDATDRLGTVLQRAANPVWDSLYQRLVRAFADGADIPGRERGQRDFLAGTELLALLAAWVTLAGAGLGRWLFPAWLGPEIGAVGARFASWVLASWSLNLACSMGTAVLVAARRFRAVNAVHAAALALNVLVFVAVGARDGELALLMAPLVGNLALCAGLITAASRTGGVPVRRVVSRLLSVWLGPALCFAPAREAESVWEAVAWIAVGSAGALAAAWHAPELRSLARDFRAPPRANTNGPSRPPSRDDRSDSAR